MNKNVVYQKDSGAKHYSDFKPLFNFGKRVIIGRYGTMAMEYLKETAPIAYNEYCQYSEFKYILAEINNKAAERFSEIKKKLKKKYPSPKTDDFYVLAKHNEKITEMAEQIVIREVVYKPHIKDKDIFKIYRAKHSIAIN